MLVAVFLAPQADMMMGRMPTVLRRMAMQHDQASCLLRGALRAKTTVQAF